MRKVLGGESYMSRSLCRDEINYLRRTEKKLVQEEERLTERQREVLQLLAEGKQMKEIGDILNMTPRTVAFHKYRAIGGPRDNEQRRTREICCTMPTRFQSAIKRSDFELDVRAGELRRRGVKLHLRDQP